MKYNVKIILSIIFLNLSYNFCMQKENPEKVKPGHRRTYSAPNGTTKFNKKSELLISKIKLLKILILAIQSNDTKCVENIILKNPNLIDDDKNNALHIAAKSANEEIFQFILKLKPELAIGENKNRQNPNDIRKRLQEKKEYGCNII